MSLVYLDFVNRVESGVFMNDGLAGWIWQRVSAVFLLFYILPVLGFWFLSSNFSSFDVWYQFLVAPGMKILGFFAAVSLSVHACVGLWVVATDYIQILFYQRIVLWVLYLMTIGSSLAMLCIFWVY